MNKRSTRWFALLLAVAMVFSILPRSCTAICGAVPQVSEEEEHRMQILISGGANSGKSSLAEQLAVAQSFQPR